VAGGVAGARGQGIRAVGDRRGIPADGVRCGRVLGPRAAPLSKNWTPTTPTSSLALADTVTAPERLAPFAGADMATVGGVVSSATVTVTLAEVVVLPAASRATALSTCVPFVAAVGSQERAYGTTVSSAPRATPSRRNCTPTTPTLSLALAETVIVPVTGAPSVGDVIDTAGGSYRMRMQQWPRSRPNSRCQRHPER